MSPSIEVYVGKSIVLDKDEIKLPCTVKLIL